MQEYAARRHAPQAADRAVIPAAHAALGRDRGVPLERATRESMESHFGHDFSRVRVHTDAAASDAASRLGARAFTIGTDIAFAGPRYEPQLLEHELEHVVEQHGAPSLQLAPDPKKRANDVKRELEQLTNDGTWAAVRSRIYPIQSAPGIQAMKDRKLGKLPELPGTLGKIKSIERFAATMRGIQKTWSGLSEKGRRDAVGKAAGDELEKASVPRFQKIITEKMTAKGTFTPADWLLSLNKDLVASSTLSDEDGAEVTNTAFHESRHAEQHFVAARYAAGMLGQDAKTIASEGGIPLKIARAALPQKITAKTDAGTANFGKEMYDAHVTRSDANQDISDQVTAEIKKLPKLRLEGLAMKKKLETDTSDSTVAKAEKVRDALRKQIEAVEKAYGAYRKIPHEADSHLVGDAASEAFKGTL